MATRDAIHQNLKTMIKGDKVITCAEFQVPAFRKTGWVLEGESAPAKAAVSEEKATSAGSKSASK